MIKFNKKLLVNRFSVFNGKLLYQDFKGELFLNEKLLNRDVDGYAFDNKYIYIYYNNIVGTEVVDFEKNDVFITSKNHIASHYEYDLRSIKNSIINLMYEEGSKFWVFQDLANLNILIKYEITDQNRSLLLVEDDLFIELKKSTLSLKNIKDSQISWSHNYSDLFEGKEVSQFGNIINNDGYVYFYLSDKGDSSNYATCKVDLKTGKLIEIYEKFGGNLILHNNRIYTASYGIIQYLDLTTNLVTKIDITEELKEKELQIHWNSFIINNNYLFFIDGHWATTNKFGIIDISQKQLIYNSSIAINDDINGNIMKVQFDSNKLYFHCSDNTLHVYEANIESLFKLISVPLGSSVLAETPKKTVLK